MAANSWREPEAVSVRITQVENQSFSAENRLESSVAPRSLGNDSVHSSIFR